MLKRIVTAFVLPILLISGSTFAAPDGSLRKMLDTQITVIEYIEIKTKLASIQRLATGNATKWGDYSSVVELRVFFKYDDNELTFALVPVDDHYFSTIAEAKSYCRDLIKEERLIVWLLLIADSSPNGWSTARLETGDFFEQLYASSKIRVSINKKYIAEELPEGEYVLRCKASLDNEGEVKSFSYNL